MGEIIINDGAFAGRKDTDFAGGVLPFEIRVKDSDWNKPEFLPTGEKQSGLNGDKMNCVTQSNHNSLEMQLNQMIVSGKLSSNHINWLNANGYIDVFGTVNFSEKFNSILNGTAEYNGNWLYKVADDAKKNGLIPQRMLPEIVDEDWDSYYNPNQITKDMLFMGKEFLKRFRISYEWVDDVGVLNIVKQLQHAPLQIIFPSHAIVEIKNIEDIARYYDSYQPWVKDIARNKITDYFKLIINPIAMNTNVKIIKDNNSPAVGFWLPANSPEGLISIAGNFGIEIAKKPDGTIDWDAIIQGFLTLK
jgi:hypothetical protein